MELQIIDPLYKVIEVENIHSRMIDLFETEFARLKAISQLGWVSEIFPSARHSKWEHAIGTYHIAKIAVEKVNGLNLHRDNFLIASLLHSIGHLPYTYSTARGVYVAACESRAFRGELNRFLNETHESLSGLYSATRRSLKDLLLFDRQLPRFFTIISLAKRCKDVGNKELMSDLLSYLLDSNNLGFQLLNLCDQVDFVVRDLYHSGTAMLALNHEALFRSVKIRGSHGSQMLDGSMAPEWAIVSSCKRLIFDRLISDTRVISCEYLFSEAVSTLLKSGSLEISSVLKQTDSELRDEVQSHFTRFEDHIKSMVRSEYHEVLSPRIYWTKNEPRTERSLVKKAIGKDWLLSARPEFLVSIKQWDRNSGQVFILSSKDSNELLETLSIADYIGKRSDRAQPYFIAETPAQDRSLSVMRLLFRRFSSVECGSVVSESMAEFLGKDLRGWLKAGVKNLKLSNSYDDEFYDALPILRTEIDMPEEAPFIFRAIAVPGFPPKEAARTFAEFIIWNQRFFKRGFYSTLKAAIKNELAKEPKSRLMEALSFVDETINIYHHSTKWIVPNLRCYAPDGAIDKEIDVVSVTLDKHVNVTLIESSTRNSPSKSAADAKKLVELQAELEKTFKDVKVVGRIHGPKPDILYSSP